MNNTNSVEVNEQKATRHKRRKELINEFQVNFFTMRPFSTFPWDSLENEARSSETSEILENILHKHEMLTADPLDVLYEALSELMCSQEENFCYKTYFLPTGDAVSLAENVALISQGTTGLVTWEAALYLAEWALENTEIFNNK
ncbi:hypothetical protein DNTS_005915 [Danionella cerebrum]|uniref:FAM86 N-terminal domain-containing protein n=1 Tax=Danionella cerebrum TaxID=2873325 RepID=A0A553N4B8_9TELE|nr:hypothetical protein DNTS_005915 [Danionella translucida]